MITVYICFLAGGAVLPLLSFLLGIINNGADIDANTDAGADTDIDADADISADTDIDAGPVISSDMGIGSMISIGLFPTSLLSLSSLAITFGAVGGIMTLTGSGRIITLVTAIIAGYLVSVVMQTLIKSLKRIQRRNYVTNENELMLYDGTIVDTILPGQVGSVSIVTLENTRVNYPARCEDEGLRLAAGKVVRVKEIKNGIFIVEPKNKYE